MISISEQVRNASAQLQRPVTELGSETREVLSNAVAQKFAKGHTHWLWEYTDDAAYIQDPKAWRWIADFVGNSAVILFFNSQDEQSMFRLNGSDLLPLLDECYHFEFYVTNESYDYLLSFNHHEYLGAAGTAKPWLQQYSGTSPRIVER